MLRGRRLSRRRLEDISYCDGRAQVCNEREFARDLRDRQRDRAVRLWMRS